MSDPNRKADDYPSEHRGHHDKDKDLAEALCKLACELRESREQRASEFEWFKSHMNLATKQDLEKLGEIIMSMTQQEVAAALQKLTTQSGKIAKEQSDRFDVLTKEIADLTAAINAGGNAAPEVVQALTDAQNALQSLDDVIPDAPTA